MDENLHTVKILDLYFSDDLSEIFIVMNYYPYNLKEILYQDDFCLT